MSLEEWAKVVIENAIREIGKKGILLEINRGVLCVRNDLTCNWPGTEIDTLAWMDDHES